jgi:hypothetical protein
MKRPIDKDFDILKKVRVVITKKERDKLGISQSYQRMNKYNPLTWLVLSVFIPIAVFQEGYANTKKDLGQIFKWK